MQIEIKIDPSCTEPRIIVVAESMSEEVQSLVKRLSVDVPQVISGISVVWSCQIFRFVL